MSYTERYGPPLIHPTQGYEGPRSWVTIDATPPTEKRVKPDDLFASATDRTVWHSEETRATYLAYQHSDPDTNGYSFLSSGKETSFDWSSEIWQCRQRTLEKIRNQNVNLAQAAIEFRQSADLFLSLTRELYTGYRLLKKGNFKLAKRVIGRSPDPVLAKKWIELQFGMLPLVSDLQGMCDSLAQGLRDGLTLRISERSSGYQTYERSYPDPAGNGMISHYESERFFARIDARYKIQNADVHDITRFGFFNIPALAWELVPYSFVVDWAIPVGAWLESLDALHSVSEAVFVHNFKTEWSASTTAENDGATATSKSVSKGRSMASSDLPLSFPRYEPSASLRKILTGAALLRLLSY